MRLLDGEICEDYDRRACDMLV